MWVKKVNQFKLEFDYNESPASNNAISVFISVEFDQIKMKDILDIDEFFHSIETKGIIPLFTCDCGVFGCGGYYVEVISEDEGLIFKNSYKPFEKPESNAILENFEFHVSWEDVIFLGNQIIDVLEEIKGKWPEHIIFSGTLGVVNLSERSNVYKNILIGLKAKLKKRQHHP